MIETIATRAGTRAVLEKYGLHTRKKLGQHFLVDPHVLDKIIRAADIGEADCVLEIGPGLGSVTQALAEHAGRVLAVELDAALIPVLRDIFSAQPQIEIHHGDILKQDPHALLSPYAGMRLKVVANLPYYVTTPVIMHLLENGPRFESLTVMVQREVAERMTASPGVKDYGALTLAVQYYAEVEIVAYVPQNCFMPRPNVDSAVVRLAVWPAPRFETDKARLFSVIRASFNLRRKTLVNGLCKADPSLTRETVTAALAACGLPADIRGETLSLADFARLADALYNRCQNEGSAGS